MVSSIIRVAILNDIFHCKVLTNQYNNNLMFAKVASQCPFTSATCVLDERGTTCVVNERGMNLVSNTRMMLVLHPPIIITIIPLKGRWDHIGVWNPTSFVNICHHKSCHDLGFYEPLLLNLNLLHKMSCHCRG
jgi:hypothetical protein